MSGKARAMSIYPFTYAKRRRRWLAESEEVKIALPIRNIGRAKVLGVLLTRLITIYIDS